jgi:pyruvate formate lyase activating enzyme
METSGFAEWTAMEKVLEFVDLVLFDIKHLEPDLHKEGTGVSNKLILENIEKTSSRVQTWLRYPLIPNYNDSDWNIRQFIALAEKLHIEKVSILPYHKWGESKYPQLGSEYIANDLYVASEDYVQQIKEKMEGPNLRVEVGR